MQNKLDITEKNYKKLVLQFSVNGFNFCTVDLLSNKITNLNQILFDKKKDNNSENILLSISKKFIDIPILTEKYDEIVVLYTNNYNSFVPSTFFDRDYLGSYLQYNTKVFETDFFAFDTLENYEINNVYIPYTNVNNFLIDQYGNFDYKHSNTILVSRLLFLSKNHESKKMFVHIQKEHFEIVVAQNQKLILFNSFEYKTPQDFIYYILFTAEQLNLNPESFVLELLGDISQSDEYFKICYKYIRNVNLLHVNFLRVNNYFSEAENLKNFILFSS